MRSGAALTVGLTAGVALILAGIAALVPLDTRNASGATREMAALDVWREMLGNLPADAPLFLNASSLAVLSILALCASVYVVVAVARLPQ
ncbi:MAG: hypothetical protein M3439_11520 [Chloroflexota bacterium]|nr:hypothetical protein [Chloroflexota bacterium]